MGEPRESNFEQFVSEHQKHANETNYSPTICLVSQKSCSWCELYRDYPGSQSCCIRICKCQTCGILCYSDEEKNYQVVDICTCGKTKKKREKYKWYDGISSDTCNLHGLIVVYSHVLLFDAPEPIITPASVIRANVTFNFIVPGAMIPTAQSQTTG